MIETLLSVFIPSFVVVVVYNIFWAIRYRDVYWEVVLFQDGDLLHSSVQWLFNLLPFIITFIVWAVML